MSNSSRSAQWSRIPPELAAEIAGHNSEDVPTLRAMSLVCKAMRSFAIEHLFSLIHFACSQDISYWNAMVRRTPRLSSIVRRVKFSDPGVDWLRRHRTAVRSRRTLRDAAVPPKIPVMPNVRVVEWEEDVYPIDIGMAAAYMALFPNTKELLLNMSFDVLEITNVNVHELTRLQSRERPTFDLTALEELRVTECGFRDPDLDFLLQLVKESPPTELKSLTLAESFDFVGPSLVNFSVLLESFDSGMTDVVEMLNHLRPALLALNTLSLWLNDQAEHVLNALQVAPNLTVLNFYIILCDDDDHKNRKTFCDILDKAFPWDAFATKPTSMRSVLLHKFPLIRRVGFYFCAQRRSTLHFRRGFARGKWSGS
ncbi:hypothetical protein B0H13DRAFT_1998652 [Mycena leptocephala]|nr:hypothetical protein B0H13DRAFT_1998652 [Mycena leptocephala]